MDMINNGLQNTLFLNDKQKRVSKSKITIVSDDIKLRETLSGSAAPCLTFIKQTFLFVCLCVGKLDCLTTGLVIHSLLVSESFGYIKNFSYKSLGTEVHSCTVSLHK